MKLPGAPAAADRCRGFRVYPVRRVSAAVFPGLPGKRSRFSSVSGSVNSGDYGTVSVSLVVGEAKAAIEFNREVFGAADLYSLTMPGGGGAHAEFKIGNTIVMNKSPLSRRFAGHAQRHG